MQAQNRRSESAVPTRLPVDAMVLTRCTLSEPAAGATESPDHLFEVS